jgi:hypothetical protein
MSRARTDLLIALVIVVGALILGLAYVLLVPVTP